MKKVPGNPGTVRCGITQPVEEDCDFVISSLTAKEFFGDSRKPSTTAEFTFSNSNFVAGA